MGLTGGGDNLGKMVKNCIKMTKSAFLGQNSGGGGVTWGDTTIFQVVGWDSPSPPPVPPSPHQSPPVPPLGETLYNLDPYIDEKVLLRVGV